MTFTNPGSFSKVKFFSRGFLVFMCVQLFLLGGNAAIMARYKVKGIHGRMEWLVEHKLPPWPTSL